MVVRKRKKKGQAQLPEESASAGQEDSALVDNNAPTERERRKKAKRAKLGGIPSPACGAVAGEPVGSQAAAIGADTSAGAAREPAAVASTADASASAGSAGRPQRKQRCGETLQAAGPEATRRGGATSQVASKAAPGSIGIAKGLPSKLSKAATSGASPKAADCKSARATRSEIDDIFAKGLKRAARTDVAAASSGSKEAPPRKQAARRRPPKGSAEDPLGQQGGWVDDGLGGVYNNEGWTGRRTDGDSMRIFKAHLLKVGAGGDTPLCPFDCECCF